jgi:dipeptide transport system substrate-binding protein
MRHLLITKSILGLSVLFVLGLSAQAKGAMKTFVYCSEASPSTFNPQLATDGPTFNASSRPIYNRLVDFERGTTKIIPSLAEKWDVSKDGKTVTFHLRKNIQFQTTDHFKPTRAFEADDVLFTFNRMLKADHPYHKVNGGVYEYFTSMDMNKLIVSIEKVDAQTVKFHLTHAEAPFIANMAMDFASILSAEYADQLMKAKTPEKLDIDPVGTGPFIWKSYRKDSEVRYEANPTYFEGKSPLDRLIFAITKDPNVRMQKLKRGECHFVAEPPPADLKALRQDPKLNVMEQEGLNVAYLAFNVEKPPFDKLEVRQAISHALNRQSYLDAIYLGNATLAKNPIPPTMWSYNEKTVDDAYDLAKAKALLTKAGFPNGFQTTLWYMPVSRPYNPNGKKMAEMMQADLAKIGIKADLQTFDWGAYLDKARLGQHQLIQMGWTGDNGDPDNFLSVLLSCEAAKNGSNYSRWCYQPFEKAITAAKITSDVRQRTKLYQEAQILFKQQAPWVTLAHSKVFRAMGKNVIGYKMSPLGTDTFYGVDLK